MKITVEEYKQLTERIKSLGTRVARMKGVLSEKESQKAALLAKHGVNRTEELVAKRDRLKEDAEKVYSEAVSYVQELSATLDEVENLLRG